MKYLHTMVRIKDIDESLDFYVNKLGLKEKRRVNNEKGKYTLIFSHLIKFSPLHSKTFHGGM